MTAPPTVPARPDPRIRLLSMLVLVTYAAHIAEEYWGGFPAWASAQTGLQFTEAIFLRLNAVFFAIMAAGVLAVHLYRPAQWLAVPLGTVVLINGTGHFVTSLATWTWSPGVVTGTLLWVPLGILLIRTARTLWTRRIVLAGVLVGVVLHLIVPSTAWLAVRGRRAPAATPIDGRSGLP